MNFQVPQVVRKFLPGEATVNFSRAVLFIRLNSYILDPIGFNCYILYTNARIMSGINMNGAV
jgi:hypothetical protein